MYLESDETVKGGEKGGSTFLVTVAGIEPATLRSGDVRSIH